MVRRRSFGLPASRRDRRVVVAICATTFLLWIGGSSVLPLLPTYLRSHGSTPGLVGVVMASYFAASVLTQYPAGKISDRVGRRPVVVLGLVLFAFGSVGFALAANPGYAVLFRSLQGIGAGAVTVASAATIGTVVDAEDRGGAFGALYGSQMLALAVGPLVGSEIGTSSMRLLFLLAAGSALVALAPMAELSRSAPAASAVGEEGLAQRVRAETLEALAGGAPAGLAQRAWRSRIVPTPAVVGVLISFFASGLLVGVYESCWSLLLHLRGASAAQIGLSWTLFALPFALLSIPAGRLADRFDRRVLAIGGLTASAAFCATYPFLHSVALLVGLGSLEAACAVIGAPASVLILTDATPIHSLGGAQGALETGRTAATALSAGMAGALFAIDPVFPFVLAAVLSAIGCIAMALAWRSLPTRASSVRAAPPVPTGERSTRAARS